MDTSTTTLPSFTFIVIPDTQKLAAHYPEIYSLMAQSIVANAQTIGASFVLHVGDIVDNGAQDELQYKNAYSALSVIDRAGIPLLIAPGNHDYDIPIVSANGPAVGDRSRALTVFNRYFGVHRLLNKPWSTGLFEHEKAENGYAIIHAPETPVLVLFLEFAPRHDVMAWADQILTEHQSIPAVVITHSYMYMYGERVCASDSANPKTKYFQYADCNDGEDMWQRYFRHHSNIVAVCSGHHIPITVSHRVDKGDSGNIVLQMFQNWQSEENGGSGRYRIIRYDGSTRTFSARVYNPMLQAFETEEGYDIVVSI